ncbi:MAG: phosphatase PAP2 family protein [Promethearchaeota archaeon]
MKNMDYREEKANTQTKIDKFYKFFPKIDAWDKKKIENIYFNYENKDHYRKLAILISYFGDPRLWIFVLIFTFIYGIIIENLSMLVVFGSALVQSYCIYYAIKKYLARPRPFIGLEKKGIKRLDKTGHGYSFPSGHSHHSTVLACMIIFWFSPYPIWTIILIVIFLILYNIGVPYSRLISGCHYPSDVIFAIIEGYLASFLHWFITKSIYLQIYWNIHPFIFS